MKKVLFFMVLLFLIGLGTANVNAQVRIGGNAAPQGAAVLDLNADNTGTPAANKGGLALPRVSLDSTTMKLNGIYPLPGTLVWNTNGATLGGGVCHFNGTNWVRTSLPATVPGDSGAFLMSNGKFWLKTTGWSTVPDTNHLTIHVDTVPVKWTRILDTTLALTMPPLSYLSISAPGITFTDWCYLPGRYQVQVYAAAGWAPNQIAIINNSSTAWAASTVPARIRCFRPDR